MIDQIQAGGSSEFKFLENVTVNNTSVNSSTVFINLDNEEPKERTFKFTPKEDVIMARSSGVKVNPTPERETSTYVHWQLKKGTEYSVTNSTSFSLCFFKDEYAMNKIVEDPDFLVLICTS